MGARGLPGRFVPRTRGARDNRGPFPVFSRVIPRLPFYLCCGRGSLRESNKKLGLALLRVGLERAFGLPLPLDLGFQLEEGVSSSIGFWRGRWGGHGFACVSVFCSGSPCGCCYSQFNARAATGVQVSVLAVSRTCRTAIYAIRQAMQPADFASLLQSLLAG